MEEKACTQPSGRLALPWGSTVAGSRGCALGDVQGQRRGKSRGKGNERRVCAGGRTAPPNTSPIEQAEHQVEQAARQLMGWSTWSCTGWLGGKEVT